MWCVVEYVPILSIIYTDSWYASFQAWFGEMEFWLALGKVLLVFMLMFYTFIVMLGGNPEGDRFGFR